MASYRGGDGHYADMECAYGGLDRHFVLSFDVEARRAELPFPLI
jgi:hypothetical protein